MTSRPTPPHRATLVLLTALSVLSLNMFLPSLGNIAEEFSADYALVSLSVAGYLAVTALVQLIAGPLSDKHGRRPVILGALVIYGVASLACALSGSLYAFLFFRLLQAGVVSGAALSMAIVRDTHSRENAVSELGYIAMAMALAPMVGPMVGGFMDSMFGWRSVFYFYAASSVFLLILCWLDLGETRRKAESDGPKSNPLQALIIDRRFLAYALCTAFSTGAFFIFTSGAPLVAARAFGYSTAQIGVGLGTITAGFMVGSFIAGRFGKSIGLNGLLIGGRLVACVGLSAGLLIYGAVWASPIVVFAAAISAGFANGVTLPSSNAGAVSVRPQAAGAASGLNAAINVACGAVLTTLTGVMVAAFPTPQTLLGLMLASASLAFVFARVARRMESEANPSDA